MRIYKHLFFAIYLFPFGVVLYLNYSMELLYITIALFFAFLTINSATNIKPRFGIAFRFPKYFISFMLIVCFAFQAPNIYYTILSIIEGDYFKLGLEKALARYSGESNFTLLEWITSSILFSISLCLGLSDPKNTKKWHSIFYLFLLMNSLSGLARASFLINIVLYLSGLLVRFSSKMKSFSIMKTLLLFVSLALFAFLVYAIPQYGRVHKKENATEIVIKRISDYSISTYYAFSEYIKDFSKFKTTKEFKTLGALSKIMGVEKKQGTYEPIYFQGSRTNLFTTFRGLVEDFGILIFPVLIIMFYYFSIRCFFSRSRIEFILLFWTIPFFLFPFYSIFHFNNVFVGYLIFSAAVLFSKPIYQS